MIDVTHYCRKGIHPWDDPVGADRCCSGEWRREVRILGTEADLDPVGRHVVRAGPYTLIYGWVWVADPAARR